jgi:hypothetical protein
MKIHLISNCLPKPVSGKHPRYVAHSCLAAVSLGLISFACNHSHCLAQETQSDEQGAQVLTRGPVHEAFAGIITYNPEPGVVVTKAPPDAIEEIPPGERPEGNNITWIPGYWAWDDERNDFLWVSGTWRALPPDREWIAGYWAKANDGFQWTSGYWANASEQETTYLPPPPKSIEDGPSTKAPSSDHGWTPGSWIWRQERYAWSPGYWTQGRTNWTWMPAHYVWSPRGYIYVDGYWDYSVNRRGTLFAPVYFNSGLYARSDYHYSPSLVINLTILTEHLFLRPNYHHYYFGDYYTPSYHQHGFFAACNYQSNRHGYDPLFAHRRWEHRQDRHWEQNLVSEHLYRRDHENARPPRTWEAMRKLDANNSDRKKHHSIMASPLDQLSKRKDGPIRYQPVDKEDLQIQAKRGKDVQKSREHRRDLEIAGRDSAALKPGELARPTRVKHDRSPIVGKSAGQFKSDEAPPAALRSPKIEPLDQTNDEVSGRHSTRESNKNLREPSKPDADFSKGKPERELRRPEAEPSKGKPERELRRPDAEPSKSKPERELRRPDAQPRALKIPSDPKPQRIERQPQPEPQRRIKEAPPQVREQPKPQRIEQNIQRPPEQPSKSRGDEGDNKPSKKNKERN